MSTRYILFILSFFVVSASAANDHLKQESYWDIQTISEPIIDPTGNKVIFAKKYIDKKNDAFISDLWVMDSSGSEKRGIWKFDCKAEAGGRNVCEVSILCADRPK